MSNETVDKSNYDIASIGRGEGRKRANFVQDALQVDRDKIASTSRFIRVFADIFLKKEASAGSYF